MLFAAGSVKIREAEKVDRQGERIAIIDLGTNSVRFDVYHKTDFQVLRIHREKRMIRLGDRVFRTERITSPATARAIRTFKDFRKVVDRLGVTKIRAFGTSALRSAKNAKAFIAKVEKESGIRITTISGSKEGDLIARGIFAHVRPPHKKLALVDIGGGSTEISICRGQKVFKQVSLKLGAARMRQMFLEDRPAFGLKGAGLSPELALRQHVRKTLTPLARSGENSPCEFVIGSSGTIRSLAKILKKMNRKDQPCHRQDLVGLAAEMRMMTKRQIAKIPGLEPKRIDMILAGAIVFEEILFALGAKKFYATQYALRDGILAETLSQGT